MSKPFRLYRPQRGHWEDGSARYHQRWLSHKNRPEKTGGNFIPAVKVLKHLRSLAGVDAVSFHLEALLHALPDELFRGGPADYITAIVGHIAALPPERWYATDVRTPVGERAICRDTEWGRVSWLPDPGRTNRPRHRPADAARGRVAARGGGPPRAARSGG